jgi:thiol-disulfide isomerase/thioredoxin
MGGSVVALGLAVPLASFGCIPSFPPCEICENKDDGGSGPGNYPDFEFLNREADCAIPLTGEPGGETGGTETGTDTGTDSGGEELACGYPSGPYGFDIGERFDNLLMFDCMANQVQIAQYIPQEGLPDVETRGVVFGLGAIWCDPCRMEGEEWAADLVDEYAPEGIQFIQALDEGAAGSPVLPASCAGWSSTVVQDKFPILYVDQVAGLRSQLELMPNEAIPFTLVFNANANIIFRRTGGVVDADLLTAQLQTLINDPYGDY